MNALDDRNNMSHTYNRDTFFRVVENVENNYIGLFDRLYEHLYNEIMSHEP